MKKLLLLLLFICNSVYGQSLPRTKSNDYGKLKSDTYFISRCLIEDQRISNKVVYVYTHEQVSCGAIKKLYFSSYTHIYHYLTKIKKYNLTSFINKPVIFRIITLAELNNPNNFAQTDAQCMYNMDCLSGAYFGRTFFGGPDINIYVVYSNVAGPFSFISSFKHELFHLIMYDYYPNIAYSEEHKLIADFLSRKELNGE
jgi:hypothetical protein